MSGLKIAFDGPLKRRLEVRQNLVRATQNALAGQVAGYCLVTWDARGNSESHIMTAGGPFASSLIAPLVYGDLVKHDAVLTVEDRLFHPDGTS